MKYIAKKKDRNVFKTFDNISEIDETVYRDHDLYAVKEINPRQFKEELKNAEIEELKQRLASLGVDLNALTRGQVQPIPPPVNQPVSSVTEPTTELPGVIEDVVEDKQTGVKIGRITAEAINSSTTQIVNRKTGKNFTMGELREQFDKFKEYVEKEIPEVIFSSFDEKGFTITVTELRRDLPKILPNGIPLRQIVS